MAVGGQVAAQSGTVTTFQTIRITTSLLRDVSSLVQYGAGTDALAAGFMSSYATTAIMTSAVTTGGLLMGLPTGMAIDAGADASYAVVFEPIYTVLSRGRSP